MSLPGRKSLRLQEVSLQAPKEERRRSTRIQSSTVSHSPTTVPSRISSHEATGSGSNTPRSANPRTKSTKVKVVSRSPTPKRTTNSLKLPTTDTTSSSDSDSGTGPRSKNEKLTAKRKTPGKNVALSKIKANATKAGSKNTQREHESPDAEYNTEVGPGPRQCPLPCRESQFADISAFLESNLKLQSSGCMYVSGVPGTGKTAIVQAVINDFQHSSRMKEKLDVIYINGLTLSAPNRIWKRFYNHLNPNQKAKMNPDAARQKLNLYFEKAHNPIILIIDELDQILDKQQAILYRLLDWTTHPSNLFSLICIFNTMHLPETALTNRNESRMGMIRCLFPPYTHEQLATIVRRSLGDDHSGRLTNEALTLLSRKVAAISGDARRALEIAKRTLELMNTNEEGKSSASSVMAVGEAFKELFSSPKTEAVKQCSDMEKLVLKSIISDLQFSDSEETEVSTVITNSIATAQQDGDVLTSDQILRLLKNLFDSKLILMEHAKTSLYNKISLNLSIPDVQFGLGAADKFLELGCGLPKSKV